MTPIPGRRGWILERRIMLLAPADVDADEIESAYQSGVAIVLDETVVAYEAEVQVRPLNGAGAVEPRPSSRSVPPPTEPSPKQTPPVVAASPPRPTSVEPEPRSGRHGPATLVTLMVADVCEECGKAVDAGALAYTAQTFGESGGWLGEASWHALCAPSDVIRGPAQRGGKAPIVCSKCVPAREFKGGAALASHQRSRH